MEKILGLKKLTWLKFFIGYCLLSICLLIGCMACDYWFYYTEEDQYGSEKTKGALLHQKGKTKSFKEEYDDCSGDDQDSGICDQKIALYVSGVFYILFSTASCLCFVISGLGFVLKFTNFQSYQRVFNLMTSNVFLILGSGFHLAGFILWAKVMKVTYGNCKHDYEFTGVKSVCAEDGTKLAIATCVITWVGTILYVLLYKKISRSTREQEDVMLETR